MCTKQNVSEIYLHVQTNNEDAIKFYKKFGFDITDTIPDYYINIEPRDCYVVTKSFAQIWSQQMIAIRDLGEAILPRIVCSIFKSILYVTMRLFPSFFACFWWP